MLSAQAGLHLIKMDNTSLFITCVASFQMIFAKVILEVKPEKTFVVERGTLNAMCSAELPISSCEWDGLKPNEFLDLQPIDNLIDGIKYHGRGFQYGECGITIINVTEKHSRLFSCRLKYLRPREYDLEHFVGLFCRMEVLNGSVDVVVAKDMHINLKRLDPVNNIYPNNTFEVNKRILAECKIESVRPSVNISWFIGYKRIKDGFGKLEIENADPRGKGLITVRQNLTRNPTHSDNGKDLVCEVYHLSLGRRNVIRRSWTLIIYFPPKLKEIQQRTFTIGQSGEIVVTTYANPRPAIEWFVDGENITEGNTDATGKFHAFHLIARGKHAWEAVLLVVDVTPEDVKRNYTIVAKNMAGEMEIRVPISACNAAFVNFSTCLPLSHDFAASTCFTGACLSLVRDLTSCYTAEITAYSSFSPDLKACPADVTAWSIAGIVTAILLIILVRFVYNRLNRTGRSQYIKIVKGPDGWTSCKYRYETTETTTEL